LHVELEIMMKDSLSMEDKSNAAREIY